MAHKDYQSSAGRSSIFYRYFFLLYFYLGSFVAFGAKNKQMKEYTLIAVLFTSLTIIIDRTSGVNLLKRPIFYLFLVFIFFFKLLINGYLTAKEIYIYNPEFFLGVRLTSIPLEDFLFGFSMVTMGIVFWEYFKKNEERRVK